jgi:peptidoglycan/xylan/chitin deacetylase (PgdA/CDA1 family)
MSTRQLVRAAVASVARRAAGRAPAGRVAVLCYHSVHPTKDRTKGNACVPPDLFEQQLLWLKEHCDLIPFRQVTEVVRQAGRTRPAVAITFDDGYADNYEHAFPLLRAHAVPVTIFVTVGLLEQEPSILERFKTLIAGSDEDVRPLEWDQVREMREAGVEFGAHTWTHANLARLALPDAEQEMGRSKEVLESRLGAPVTTMAYPFGKPRRHFTAETMDLARRLGYESAAAVLYRSVRSTDSPLAIPRFFVACETMDVLRDKVYGYWNALGWWQERAPLWAARLLAPKDFGYS